MTKQDNLKILIGSIGRRVYLTRWFEDALRDLGQSGEVHVTDADIHSSGMNSATFAHALPRYEDTSFHQEMLDLCSKLKPDLFFSVNDYELAYIARTGLASELEALGTTVLSLEPTKHAAVHDKYELFKELSKQGIRTPETTLLSNTEEAQRLADLHPQVVIKDRFGSGSSGLKIVESSAFEAESRSLLATQSNSKYILTPGDQYVVQPAIQGQEYGLDIIRPIIPDAHRTTVLARAKTRMRSGETDQAVSVDPSCFQTLGDQLALWTEHRGLIDIDVIVDHFNEIYVIDVNPRFGGGYPFNHLAGANIPALYISQLISNTDTEIHKFLAYDYGVKSSKFEDVSVSRESHL